MRLQDLPPTVEITGGTLAAILSNLHSNELKPVLKDLGITQVDPNQWYPLTIWRTIFEAIMDQPNLSSKLVAIGLEIGLTMDIPAGQTTLADVLAGWDDLYHLHHRHGEVGHVLTQAVSPTHIKVAHPATYPADFVYGMAYGLAKRLRPQGATFSVKYDPNEPSAEEGNEYVVLDVEWGAA